MIAAAFWLFVVVAAFGLWAGTRSVVGFLLLLGLAVVTVYEGLVVCLVQELRRGNTRTSVRHLFTEVAPAALTLLLAGFSAAVMEGIGLSFFILPGLLLITVWALMAPVIVIEETGVIDGFRRSQQLVRDFAWKVFVSVIVANLATAVVTLGVIKVAASGGPILMAVLGTLAITFTAPIVALVGAILYYRLIAIKGPAPPRIELPPPGPVI